jgi:hypothetical protein
MKQKRQLIVLAVLLFVAVGVWYARARNGGETGNGPLAIQNVKLLDVPNPDIHWNVLKAARSTEYHGTGRNPFSTSAPAPEAPKQNIAKTHDFSGPVPPPPPPPVQWPANLQFFGYGTVPNGTSKRAFFRDGEDIYIFAEGDTVLGRYRILKINNTSLEFEELSTGRRATTPLLEDQAAQANASNPS